MGLTEQEPPVRIRCAEDLFRVLSEGSLFAQMAVLRDILQEPVRAIKLGRYEGEDLVDLLIRLVPESAGPVRQAQTLCLMSFQDPRTTEFMAGEFARCRDAAMVLRLAQRLTIEKGPEFFLPFLWSPKAAQALAAARICHSGPLTAAEQLRVALVLDADFAPPPVGAQTLDVWLTELQGPHRLRTRELAEAAGALPLWEGWDALATEEREWLLTVTERQDWQLARTRTEKLLAAGETAPFLLAAAVRLELELPAGLWQSPTSEVRALALAAGQADAELARFLTDETPLVEVVAAVPRCPRTLLLSLLLDSRWQVRAEAVKALAAQEPALEKVRPLALSETLETRVAAVELLLQWGDDEWLAEQFAV